MALLDKALEYLKGKSVIVVTGLVSEGYLQELTGVLVDGADGCLMVQQEDDPSPIIINEAYIAWIYEDTGEEDEGKE